MIVKKLLLATAAVFALSSGSALAADDAAAIAERLKPYGSVCVAGDPCAEVAAAAAAPAAAAVESGGEAVAAAGRPADAIYKQFCTVCHSIGLAGAPVTGDTAAWQTRLDAQGGMDGLVASGKRGVGGMPPMGTCANCTDDEMADVIKYMSGL